MVGKGLELIYNEQTGRLDFLHIMRLDNLSLKIPREKKRVFAWPRFRQQTANGRNRFNWRLMSRCRRRQGNYYKCALNGNVVITSPEQVVFADELLVSDIFQSKEKKSARP